MEMANKKVVRCSHCGVQTRVPHITQAMQCLLCQNITHFQLNDPLGQAHNSIIHAASRIKHVLGRASNNINMIRTTGNNYPQPTRLSVLPAAVPSFSAHGRKRAVLCGVSYIGQRYELQGTVNDVKSMRYFLTQKLGFPSDCILVLTEEESNPSLIPTKSNIRKALQWLVQGCQSRDSLVFHYSGHGSQQRDLNGDEIDGYDEVIWPVDHQKEGEILDDEINATIVRPLPQGAKLHAIIDACHSGTILDLPFVCRVKRDGYYLWEDHGYRSPIYKGTSGGLAVSFSACDDHQVSADTTAFTGNTATGALTYSFIQAVHNEPGLTYGRLLNSLHRTISDTNERFLSNGPVSSLVRKVLSSKLSQEPALDYSNSNPSVLHWYLNCRHPRHSTFTQQSWLCNFGN